MNPGNIIWTPPGVAHCHGGTRSSGLRHVAVSEDRNGASVQWLDHVTGVVEPSGELVAFVRMDGVPYGSIPLAQYKARTSARFRTTTVSR